ncbi:MAG: TfoX/Sxy family protein [Myxococcales bacterium]|nr:TfoX/Sxy family protein [Myxococcales bacterium]
MAYDEILAERIRTVLHRRKGISERRMFGGLAFMAGGNMSCGVVRDELMVRVGPQGYDEALAQPHARPMDFTGRPLRGMVYVGKAGLVRDEDLQAWVMRGLEFARSLPAKG